MLTSCSVSSTKAEITAVRPSVSSAARSVEWIRTGVTASCVMPVKLALNRVLSRFTRSWSTEIGRCTSLLFAVLFESVKTMMKVLAST